MTWNKSHHSSSLNSAREEAHRGNKACWEHWRRFLVNFTFSLPLLPLWLRVAVPSITLWPLTCRGLARGPGQQVEARAEMTLGGSQALSDREHPSPSVTTTRAQSSIWKELVVVGRAGEELGGAKGSDKDWWLRGSWSSIIISQVWDCETASSHSGIHRWSGNGWEMVHEEK